MRFGIFTRKRLERFDDDNTRETICLYLFGRLSATKYYFMPVPDKTDATHLQIKCIDIFLREMYVIEIKRLSRHMSSRVFFFYLRIRPHSNAAFQRITLLPPTPPERAALCVSLPYIILVLFAGATGAAHTSTGTPLL